MTEDEIQASKNEASQSLFHFEDKWLTDSEVHERLCRLRELEERDRWIPVTERLPAESGWFHVTVQTVGPWDEDLREPFTDQIYFFRMTKDWDLEDQREVTAWRELPEPYRGEGARKGQALAEVTAERDQLRNATHVASYERGIAEGRKQSEHNLNQLLDAVEAWRDSYSRPLREPYNEALAENAAIAMVNLAAKIRKERS